MTQEIKLSGNFQSIVFSINTPLLEAATAVAELRNQSLDLVLNALILDGVLIQLPIEIRKLYEQRTKEQNQSLKQHEQSFKPQCRVCGAIVTAQGRYDAQLCVLHRNMTAADKLEETPNDGK